ncbi:MAG: hypothetical protein LBC18_14310 [Opitutaceae bacterium]|jgi:hypothetical protein|nr:hypothetical protein [Opitutaceae bacterium]
MKTTSSYKSQRAHGGRGGKYGPRGKTAGLRGNLNIRIYSPMIMEMGKIAYRRGLSTSRLFEMAAFKIIAESDAATASRISTEAPDLFPQTSNAGGAA